MRECSACVAERKRAGFVTEGLDPFSPASSHRRQTVGERRSIRESAHALASVATMRIQRDLPATSGSHPLLEGGDFVCVLQREGDVVQAVNHAVLTEGIDVEFQFQAVVVLHGRGR